MTALGELPRIDLAVHADTQHEHQATYKHAAKWTPCLADRDVRVITVQEPRTDIIRPEWAAGSVMMPAFTQNKQDGSHGQITRQCTREWKIVPMRKHLRTLLPKGRLPPGCVECWQGITLDE